MPAKEYELELLKQFLPHNTYDEVAFFLHRYSIQLRITRTRATVLGDYRRDGKNGPHRISINGNLNSYAFLITLLHEIAHLLTHEQYGNRVQAHGKEWQKEFSILLSDFIRKNIFPEDITGVLKKSLHKPAASSCADTDLLRVLRNYDAVKEDHCLVEELSAGAFFVLKDKRQFRVIEKLRKRIKCEETATGRIFLFSPVYEVIKWMPAG